MMVPQVLGSIRTLFPSAGELSRALSFYGVMMGLAASIGQFAGGALVEWSPFDLGWRTVFLAKLPIGIPVMLAAWLMLPETRFESSSAFDAPPNNVMPLSRLPIAAVPSGVVPTRLFDTVVPEPPFSRRPLNAFADSTFLRTMSVLDDTRLTPTLFDLMTLSSIVIRLWPPD